MSTYRVGRLSAAVLALALGAAVMPAAASRPATAPRPVTPQSQTVVSDPQFQWHPARGATVYRLEVAQDRAFSSIVHTVNTAATRYVDSSSWAAGEYWWRVQVVAPYVSAFSQPSGFTRRWIDTHAGARVARPDTVSVADFSPDPGVQVPANALQISWEPVSGASYYEVQFDGAADKVCTTPHTVFTPYTSGQLSTPDTLNGCAPALAAGAHWVRVRAVDETVSGTKLFSLWSDEARAADERVPSAAFTVGPPMPGSANAELLAPTKGAVFQDVPTFAWQPVSGATEYELVLALDQDFTNPVGRFRTTNTRLVPLQRLPENTGARAYYWYVAPCKPIDGSVQCRDRAEGRFKKQPVVVRTLPADRRGTPWVGFRWEPYALTMNRFAARTGSGDASMGGIKWYEVQIAPRGADWSSARTLTTDVPVAVPSDVRFGSGYQWRVRPVDETGAARPWSEVRSVRLPKALPRRPGEVDAARAGNRVTLRWTAARSRYFPVTGYALYFSTNGTRWKPLVRSERRHAAFTVRKGQRYWFMVTARNLAGEGPPSRVYVPR